MRGSPVFKPIFKQICSYIIEKIFENSQKRPNLGTRPVIYIIFNSYIVEFTTMLTKNRKIFTIGKLIPLASLRMKYNKKAMMQ